MIKYNLQDMKGGWFIGNFSPTVLKTKEFEVAIKYYKKGDKESCHHHKIAEEFTVIVEGKVKMFSTIFTKGDIIKILPNEETDFIAITDVITVVVKNPSVKNDKYFNENE